MSAPRRIAVVTGTRADYSPLRSVLRALDAAPDFELQLIVAAAHLERRFGRTVDAILADGFTPAAEAPMDLSDDSAAGVTRATARGLAAFADAFAALKPDLLLLLGDRFETHAAALAALPRGLPVAHIHGGELTFGAMDDALRHSLTKLAHLHFAATAAYARRIVQMGEAPERVHVVGAPGLDDLLATPRSTPAALEARLGLPLAPAPLVATYHPETLRAGADDPALGALLQVLAAHDGPIVVTAPNADPGGAAICDRLSAFCAERPKARFVDSLGAAGYAGLMAIAGAMIGNSSSGVIEAPSFGLPAINIGGRQDGRIRAANVIDVPGEAGAIAAALERALDPAFRRSLDDLPNPYGDGRSAARILAVLRGATIDDAFRIKRFHDLAFEEQAA